MNRFDYDGISLKSDLGDAGGPTPGRLGVLWSVTMSTLVPASSERRLMTL